MSTVWKDLIRLGVISLVLIGFRGAVIPLGLLGLCTAIVVLALLTFEGLMFMSVMARECKKVQIALGLAIFLTAVVGFAAYNLTQLVIVLGTCTVLTLIAVFAWILD